MSGGWGEGAGGEGERAGPGAGEGAPGEARAGRLDPRMLEALVCPLTHATLEWDAGAQELISRKAGLAYPVRAGIPIMLESEARILDP